MKSCHWLATLVEWRQTGRMVRETADEMGTDEVILILLGQKPKRRGGKSLFSSISCKMTLHNSHTHT